LVSDGGKSPGLRELGLSDDEVRDVVLFLRALNGGPVDAAVATAPARK
jgi:hypothetical protein